MLDFARDRIPKQTLHQATLQARLFSPEEATQAGFLDDAVEVDKLVATAMAVAERLGALPQPAFANSKVKLNANTVESINAGLAADSSSFDGAS